MSFFDETDEPRPAPRTRRPSGTGRRPSGTGRRPPTDPQAIMVRRAIAGVAILVVLILMVVGIHSCQVSATNSALKGYNVSVGSLIRQSDATGKSLFKDLTGAASDSSIQTQLDTLKSDAQSELQQGQNLSVPGQVQTAQQNLLLTLSFRSNGIADIARNIQAALTRKTARPAIDSIATDMEQFLTSDVVYTTQTAPQIAAALHAAGIPVGSNGETIVPTSFFPDLGLLTQSYIATKLGASLASTTGGSPCPPGGNCGHLLTSVSVGGVPLSTGGQTIPASPAPTFTADFTNDGTNTESNVTVQVVVTPSAGTPITAQKVVPTTKPGQTYSPQITLSKTPPAGQAEVVVMVEGVPGENDLANNKLSFPVTFG